MDFNKLNLDLYQFSMPHRYPRKCTNTDKGYMKGAEWVADMCFYYDKKKKEFDIQQKEEFLRELECQKLKILKLKDGDYKKGLLEAITIAIKESQTR